MAAARKVVFVGNFALWRKATMSDRSLPMARELRAAGHDAVVIVPPWDDPAQSCKLECHWGVPVRNVAVRPGPLGHVANLAPLLSAVLAERPDVIVAVKPKAYAGLLALLFGAMGPRGRRPVRLVVDTDDWEGTGGWNDLTDAPAVAKLAVAWHERAALWLADHVIVASRALQTLAAASGVAPGRLTYVPNATWEGAAGWPTGDGVRARADLGLGDAPTLLLYSRLFEFDLERIAGAVARVLTSVPDARLLVVGTGLRGEERRLRAALADVGVLERAALVGWAARERIPDLLAAGDIALVPLDDTLVNRCRCSVKLLDLMLSGRPIVAERVGQIGEYLRDRESARLVESGDTDGFVSAAVDLLGDAAAARRLGEGAARTARECHAWHQRRDALVTAVLGADGGL